MCITFSRAASGQPKTAFSPVHKYVHKLCINRALMHRVCITQKLRTSYAQVKHKLCTGIVLVVT